MTMLQEKIQVLSLQAFLVERSASYRAVTLVTLVDMFGLTARAVKSAVNMAIVQGLLVASWSADEDLLLFVDELPSRVETLTLQALEKVYELNESNEHVKEVKGGNGQETKTKKKANGVFGQRPARSRMRVSRMIWLVC